MPDSIHEKILEALQTQIKRVGLTGIAETNIVTATAPTDAENVLPGRPGVIVCPFGTERFGAGTNLSEDIGYPSLAIPRPRLTS